MERSPHGFSEHVKLLQFIAENQKEERTFWPADERQAQIFDELLKAGLISGRKTYMQDQPYTGLYEAMITVRGRQFIIDQGKLGGEKGADSEGNTLLNYWRRATGGDRFGLVSLIVGLVTFGYLLAKNRAVSRLIELIRDVMP